MAKIADVQEVSMSLLRPYERNAKIHGDYQLSKLKDSIREFGFLTPCLIDRDYNLIAGHGRVMAAQQLGMKTVPCVFVEGLTDAQRRAYILADNRLGELGEWDMALANDEIAELVNMDFDVSLTGFEIEADWFETREKWNGSREEGNDEYNDFLDKFENAKTTDDCYTPDNVYEAVVEYVEKKYGKKRSCFVRPFYPGGDYQKYAYKKNDIVVDNPPFSILAQIIDFYVDSKRLFFLFAPGLSTLGYTTRKNVAAICTYAGVTYENGASVATSFVTNMEPEDVAAIAAPDLYQAIDVANSQNESAMHKSFPKYEYPAEVATAAKIGYLSKYGQPLIIKRSESAFIRCLDAQKEQDKGIYGSALLLSEKATAEKAAAEKAAAEKAAAEKAAAEKVKDTVLTVWPLSDREQAIVKGLG